MNRLAIRLLTLAILSLTLAAAPVVSVVYAAPDNDPPPPDKKKKKSSEARPGIEQTAFADGYRAAYAAIYERHDYSSSITQLKADGSTTCGCWIYCGCYAGGVNQTARRLPGRDQHWVAPEWGWAWPANRRILYNRASADPERARAQGRPEPRQDLAVLRPVAGRTG